MPDFEMDRRGQTVKVTLSWPWLIAVCVGGIFQFGLMYKEFKDIGETVSDTNRRLTVMESTVTTHAQIDNEQDRRLNNLERRR